MVAALPRRPAPPAAWLEAAFAAFLLTFTACQADPPSSATPAPEPAATTVTLSPRELLIRASLDTRGIRPTELEYAAVEADPAAVDGLIDGFLQDARFGDRLRAMFAPVFRTRIDAYTIPASDYGIDDEAGFQASVGDEPLRMLSYIAENDLPYTDFVTADWTMANELLGRAWPVDYPAGGTGWQRVQYTDTRPAAGVLAANALWWRHPSDGVNYNRGRANNVSRIFLCNDYSSRPVEFDDAVDLTDEEMVQDALKANPTCVNCHGSLDPLASYFFGFQYTSKYEANELSVYHPERERMWEDATGVAPAYYGVPSYTLRDLGQQVAGDPRYVECAVQRVYELMLDREAGLEDTDALTRHREVFLQNDLRLRPLLRSVLLDPRYRSSEGSSDGTLTRKVMTPELLESAVEDLTGFRFTSSGYDMLQIDLNGLRSLGGGADGTTGVAPAKGPTPAMLLVQERIAEGAAWYVTWTDAASPDQKKLFTRIDFTETPDAARDAMVSQLQALHRRIFGTNVAADGQEVAAGLELWSELYAADPDTREAWAGVLSVLLRDPDFILY